MPTCRVAQYATVNLENVFSTELPQSTELKRSGNQRESALSEGRVRFLLPAAQRERYDLIDEK